MIHELGVPDGVDLEYMNSHDPADHADFSKLVACSRPFSCTDCEYRWRRDNKELQNTDDSEADGPTLDGVQDLKLSEEGEPRTSWREYFDLLEAEDRDAADGDGEEDSVSGGDEEEESFDPDNDIWHLEFGRTEAVHCVGLLCMFINLLIGGHLVY